LVRALDGATGRVSFLVRKRLPDHEKMCQVLQLVPLVLRGTDGIRNARIASKPKNPAAVICRCFPFGQDCSSSSQPIGTHRKNLSQKGPQAVSSPPYRRSNGRSAIWYDLSARDLLMRKR